MLFRSILYIVSSYSNSTTKFNHFKTITEKYNKHKILFNFNDLTTNVEYYKEMHHSYGSSVRDEAMILEVLTLLGENSKGKKLFDKLLTFDFANFLNFPRIQIYTVASKFILQSPLLGWGPSTFNILFEKDWITNNPDILEYPIFQHTHNITFELAYNFGIPLAIIMCLFIFKIIKKAIFIIFKNAKKDSEFLINKTWFLSVIIILISQISDVTYYDGKISILVWILLAGLKSLIEENIPEKTL